MKKCGYCAKEIDYNEMFCCDECQRSVNEFHEMREKNQSFFSAVNGFCVLGIGVCIFLYSLLPDIAVIAGSACLMVLGGLYFLFPFPAEVMIEKYKLKKALFYTKIVAGVLLALGALAMILHLFGLF